MSRNQKWTLVKAMACVTIVVAFLLLSIPTKNHGPELIGMPLVLWGNVLNAFFMFILTWIGTKVHPGRTD